MIVTESLTKRYGKTRAVDDLSFTVTPGVVTGFLGPNGSGKSTTMRMVMGLDAPDAGRAIVNGVRYDELRWPLREVGALLDAKAFHPGRSARNHLRCLARTNEIPFGRVDEVLDTVGLTSVADQRAGKFSLGMGQRLGIASALLGGSGRAPLRRARQRSRPRRHPVGPSPAARRRRGGADRPRLEPPDQRDGPDCEASGRHRPRHSDRRNERGRLRRPARQRLRADRDADATTLRLRLWRGWEPDPPSTLTVPSS
jgi:hypothetical protein